MFTGDEGWEGGAQYSRAVHQMWQQPCLSSEKEEFFESLSDFVAEQQISLIYPVSESFVTAFMDHPDWVENLPPVAMNAPEQIRACLDKFGMYERAQRVGVPTLLFAKVENEIQLSATIKSLGLPLVIRPESPTGRFDNKKVFTVQNDDDLKWFLDHWEPHETALLCQRHASGPRHNIYFAADRGQIFQYLEARIIKTDVPDGSGLATEGITVEPNAQLREFTEALCNDLNYTGIGCAQYLVDPQSGEISFLEINSRIAGNHKVPEAAGLQLTDIPILLAFDQPLDFVRREGRVGLRYVWTTGAFVGAKVGWIRGDLSIYQSIGWMIRAIFWGIVADIHMVFSWRDPKPAFMALCAVLPSLAGITRRVKSTFQRKFK